MRQPGDGRPGHVLDDDLDRIVHRGHRRGQPVDLNLPGAPQPIARERQGLPGPAIGGLLRRGERPARHAAHEGRPHPVEDQRLGPQGQRQRDAEGHDQAALPGPARGRVALEAVVPRGRRGTCCLAAIQALPGHQEEDHDARQSCQRRHLCPAAQRRVSPAQGERVRARRHVDGQEPLGVGSGGHGPPVDLRPPPGEPVHRERHGALPLHHQVPLRVQGPARSAAHAPREVLGPESGRERRPLIRPREGGRLRRFRYIGGQILAPRCQPIGAIAGLILARLSQRRPLRQPRKPRRVQIRQRIPHEHHHRQRNERHPRNASGSPCSTPEGYHGARRALFSPSPIPMGEGVGG